MNHPEKAPRKIAFDNRANPTAGFDLIHLEDLQTRDDLDHSPFQLHLVKFYLIIYIVAGEGLHTIDFTPYRYGPGTILTVRKDQLHKFHFSEQVQGKMLLFTDDFLISYLEASEAMKSIQLFNDVLSQPTLSLQGSTQAAVASLIERIRKEYIQLHDEYSLSIIRSELQILIAKLYRIKASSDQVFTNRKYLGQFIEFQRLIEANIVNEKSVAAYGKMMGLSTKTLSKITRNVVNKSAKAFIDDICTIQIKRLLLNTPMPVKEVAYAAGFEEPTNFYKYFKRQTGQTPEQFRAANR